MVHERPLDVIHSGDHFDICDKDPDPDTALKDCHHSLRVDKFPEDYCFTLQVSEKQLLVENFDRFSVLKHSTVEPKAFTEKGLYMLATILKSARATEATISIIETFAKLRELSRTLNNLPDASEEQQKSLLEKSGDLFTDLLDNNLQATDSETTIELNLAVLKVKHTVKRKADKE